MPSLKAFVHSRLSGIARIETIFWRDMMLTGTSLTLATFVAAMLLLAQDYPTPLVLLIYFMTMPYNIFITIAVWRGASQAGAAGEMFYRASAVLWLVMTTLL